MYTYDACLYYNSKNHFYVEFSDEILNNQNMLIRLMLHYYAKMLCNFEPNDINAQNEAKSLIDLLDKVTFELVNENIDILKITHIDNIVSIYNQIPKYQSLITMKLINKDGVYAIITEIPENINIKQITYSVIVLLLTIIQNLNMINIARLQNALLTMQLKYHSGINYSEIDQLILIPNTSFI